MNQSIDLASREIFWNIPFSYKIAMYVLFFCALAVLIKGLNDKLIFVTSGEGLKGIKKILPKNLQWGKFFHTLLLTGKVPRFKNVAIFHGLIFWGFIVLWIATDLVAIHADTPFKIYKGTTYIVVSFAADIAGIMILVGLSLAYYRRYIRRPAYLSATKPKQELFMYFMLAALVLLGYLIEGVRILGTGMPINEATWSPVGWALASLFDTFGLENKTWATIYRGMWLVHMTQTMAFIASVGHTKFFHLFALPLQALITPPRRGAVLRAMDFENMPEDVETFGLAKLSELTSKNKFDLLTCVECGRCTQVCPANISGRPLDPKKIITKLRDFAFETLAAGEKDGDLWVNPLFTSIEIDSCTTCGACMEECPANIEHVDIIMEAKRYKALTLGEIPTDAATAINKTKINGNPWGISQDDRFKWADGLEVPVIETGKRVDFLYYVGCAGSYDSANQQVVKDTIGLLKKAGVSFAVMGKTEKCNGDPVRRFGDEYSFYEIAIENIANMRQYEFGKVVTHCPHCLHTIGKEYAQFEDGAFETLHHTELLAELLRTGKLRPTKKSSQEMTFHDPCYLGRHHGEYNAPREILKATGTVIKEMEKSKDQSLCCGMGGGNMWYELPEGGDMATKRLKHVGEKNVQKLATACSFCMINFNSAKGAEGTKTDDLQIEDVASILAKTIL